MKVKELISILKKMPQNITVGYSEHDNSDWEISSYPKFVDLFDKKINKLPDYVSGTNIDWYKSQPNKVVVLKG